ncbi:SHOCT domain-containing protein [Salinarchaeum sp. Harcht-Bsk1]|uniref:SHOCT domain-containing protein n=1 Tax=Salinarchaeum sp. Harcht-Bsk1 TaxID=1333523 RepID=UPI001181C6C3|nr:SHOCT domain-containing protein [Salinarchaeum sp. Harcht-Bsk1]
MSELIMKARGGKVRISGNTNERTFCGKIKIFDDRMEIQQRGNVFSKGWITIPYSEIKSISQSTLGKLTVVTESNDYKVSGFSGKNTRKDPVKEIKKQMGRGSDSKSANQELDSPQSVADEIEKLADLNERGALTDEEFQEKKEELL